MLWVSMNWALLHHACKELSRNVRVEIRRAGGDASELRPLAVFSGRGRQVIFTNLLGQNFLDAMRGVPILCMSATPRPRDAKRRLVHLPAPSFRRNFRELAGWLLDSLNACSKMMRVWLSS